MRANEFIIEALTPAQTAKLFKDLGARYDANIHSNVFNGKSRIYVPMPTAPAATVVSPTQTAVQSSIAPAGFQIDDYAAGIASKISDPTRKIKIGKLIKDQQLLQSFANDPARAASKQQAPLEVVFSRDPVDIAGMSTDRGWVSCMDLDGGCNRKFVPAEIKNGAIIAYLIRNTDKEIQNPIARILMKPYFYKNHMIIHADQVYGTAPPQFNTVVNQFVKWANSGSPEGDYKLSRTSYVDTEDNIQTHIAGYEDILNSPVKKQLAVAQSADSPPEVLLTLTGSANRDVLRRVGGNKSSPPEALDKLTGVADGAVLHAVARNTSTAPATLLRIVKLNDQASSIWVASNESCPPDLLDVLSNSKHKKICELVAANENTSPETLTKLSTHRESSVRQDVAQHPNTPFETLIALSTDKDEYVVSAVLRSESIPPKVLESIIMNLNINKRATADTYYDLLRSKPNLTPESLLRIATSKDEDVLRSLAKYKTCPLEILKKLATHKDDVVAANIASRSDLTSDLAHILLTTPRTRGELIGIKEELVTNDTCPPEVLIQLANDKSTYIAASIAGNDNTPRETLYAMLKREDIDAFESDMIYSVNCPPEVLRKYATSPRANLRNRVMNHLSTPIDILQAAAATKDRMHPLAQEYAKITLEKLANKAAA